MLEVRNLNVAYAEAHILWDVNFQVGSGEIVALIGSNGAGKTTLLKTISGLMRPQSGSIDLLGSSLESMHSDAIVKHGVVHVPEGRGLFSGMTVEDNLQMGAYSQRKLGKLTDNLEKVYTLFPVLKNRKSQLAGKLSGGEQQMCAIGRGLMSRPKIMLIDECSLGLAPVLVEELFQALQQINRDGVTIFLVEQDVQAALEISHRAYVLEQGRVVMEGPAAQLMDEPKIRSAYLGI